MPELPEVETVKNSLKDLIIGKTITHVDIYYERIIQNVSVDEFKESLINQKFIDIQRRGKYLIFILDSFIILGHLRMEGKYFLRKQEAKSKHEHVIFHLDDKTTLRYDDTRKFGVMYLFKTNSVEEIKTVIPLNNLGYEPFDKELNTEYLKAKLSKSHKPIKTVLLDQSIICGLGNIYADEVLFMCSLNPLTKASELNNKDYQNIIDSSITVLNKAITLGGTTIRSFLSSHEISGRFQNELLVHTKEICPNCKERIEKIYVGGRGTYYCKKCQGEKK